MTPPKVKDVKITIHIMGLCNFSDCSNSNGFQFLTVAAAGACVSVRVRRCNVTHWPNISPSIVNSTRSSAAISIDPEIYVLLRPVLQWSFWRFSFHMHWVVVAASMVVSIAIVIECLNGSTGTTKIFDSGDECVWLGFVMTPTVLIYFSMQSGISQTNRIEGKMSNLWNW